MQSPFGPKRGVPATDFGTIRQTLAYIRDDIARVPGMEQAADLLGSAIAEVDAVERRRLPPVTTSLIEARWLARGKH